MWSYQAYIALQIAEERAREAADYRLAALAQSGRPKQTRSIRRSVAVGLASISSVAASATRRLDQHVADDLAERLGAEGLVAGH
jgi:hypothetical protein